MTLANGLVHEGKAYLWTDTAIIDVKSGEHRGHIEKAFHGLHWPWAAVHSGEFDMSDPHRVKRLIAEANPMDGPELIAASERALLLEAAAGRQGRLLVAHTCPTYGARLWFIASDENPVSAPFKAEEFLQMTSSGNGSARFAELDAKGFNPRRMRQFIDWQFANPSESVLGYSVPLGGNVIELEVSDAGVERKLAREFV